MRQPGITGVPWSTLESPGAPGWHARGVPRLSNLSHVLKIKQWIKETGGYNLFSLSRGLLIQLLMRREVSNHSGTAELPGLKDRWGDRHLEPGIPGHVQCGQHWVGTHTMIRSTNRGF